MPLVPAKCPECGGNIKIDSDKKVAICEFCKQPFIVEVAINNFNTTYNITNNNEIKADVVNVYESKDNVDALIKRMFMFLEIGNWDNAKEYCERILDVEPENAYAYVGKLMVDLKVKEKSNLAEENRSFEDNYNYKKAICFADESLKEELLKYIQTIENNQVSYQYINAVKALEFAKTYDDFESIAERFDKISGYKDSDKLAL